MQPCKSQAMTNPGGMAPPSGGGAAGDHAPLFPRHHLQPVENGNRRRDLQVWPRGMVETDSRHSLHRNAAVKHHLRGMAGRDEMLTTYEHDFAMMTKPNVKGRSTSFGASFYGQDGKASTAHRDLMRTASATSPSRISASKAWQEDNDDVKSTRSACSVNLGRRERDQSGTLGPSTLSKMSAMRSDSDPMRLTVNGWGDTVWNPAKHPSQVLGMSAKRCGLVQNCHIMNLRAADLPFATR